MGDYCSSKNKKLNLKTMIKLLMIEDHPVTIAGLRSYFRPSRDAINITQTAKSINEAIEIGNPDSFDLVLLDLWLPEGEPCENFQRLSQKFPLKPIVIYTSELSLHWQRKMFNLGIKAFLNKTSDKSQIEKTLIRVMNGEIVFPAAMTEYQTKRIVNGFKDPKYGLSKEQNEIIKLFIEGLPPIQIGVKLGKDPSTINNQLRRIRKIFDASNNVDLAKILLNLDDFTSLDAR
jgi:DNA-binding NarL/FixJ family response regulator